MNFKCLSVELFVIYNFYKLFFFSVSGDEGASTIEELMKRKVHFHKTGENFKTDGYVSNENTMQLLKEHLRRTGGKVNCRKLITSLDCIAVFVTNTNYKCWAQ